MTDPDGSAPEHLTDRDRLVVREARREIVENPLPPSAGPVGCLAALLGGAALVAWPAVADFVPGGEFAGPFVLLGAVLALVGGVVWSLFGGSTGRTAAGAAVEAALRQLESGEGDRQANLRAATLLLTHAYVTQGPATTPTFDPDEVRPRLGGARPLVLAVERYLAQEVGAYPVFDLGAIDA
jgi:hypothetical protein